MTVTKHCLGNSFIFFSHHFYSPVDGFICSSVPVITVTHTFKNHRPNQNPPAADSIETCGCGCSSLKQKCQNYPRSRLLIKFIKWENLQLAKKLAEIITKYNINNNKKKATQLSLLQKVPTCSQVTHKQKKHLTIHVKVQECQLWFCKQCPSVRRLPSRNQSPGGGFAPSRITLLAR